MHFILNGFIGAIICIIKNYIEKKENIYLDHKKRDFLENIFLLFRKIYIENTFNI